MFDSFHDLFAGVNPTANSTCATFLNGDNICLPPLKVPFYFAMRQNTFDGVPDNILALAAPVVAYWSMSLIFYCLDMSGWTWLDKYRIHESDEVTSRNLATRLHVFRAVIIQHILQTILGYYWVSDPPIVSPSKCMTEMEVVGRTLVRLVRWMVGPAAGNYFLELRGADVTYWSYWWGIPAAQLLFSLFIVDTWQYFLHRWLHMNKFLYKHLHSVHHRLYVPYAFGALYNHPLEGFLVDSVGAVVAETVANLSVRQTIFLFAFSSMKTVDDHCGYSLPFDPFQMLSGNTADYHDIHHQVVGIKSNFSQPFFIHWDVILGTRMTRKDIEERKQKLKIT
ncbi:fatty acid hydroxylase superfamily-domain-containing protein [Boletus edulis BED1]|uniref:Fatty acid hydroxylase superfamily-domain-containing protein n=1 Tax=Boletus edulis BED1 TaxID=1328754 RepID=A0AAD4C5B5_BOLED|nr:fatty acid hydroxylase superfamily-domain-containing protein [Boletus edulis BED1]